MESYGKKYSTHAIDWIVFVPYWLFVTLIVLMPVGENSDVVSIALMVSVIAYFLFVVAVRQMRPRFVLYEKGILVIDKGETTFWSWDKLTHLDGVRKNYRANAIPYLKIGANQFYAGDEPAFRIGALTGQADVMVSHILMHIAEEFVAQHIDAIRNGEKRVWGKIAIDEASIEGYRWQEIQGLHFDDDGTPGNYRVLANIKGNPFTKQFGHVQGMEAYILMGAIDALSGSKYLHAKQQENPGQLYRFWRFMKGTGWKLTLIGLLFMLFVWVMSLYVKPA